jgi:hypothetical protein
MTMPNYDWARLTKIQLHKFAVYNAEMEFASYGFDINPPRKGDHSFDFSIMNEKGQNFEIKVNAVRGYNYIFYPKEKFSLRENYYAVVVILFQLKAPQLFLIPFATWHKPNNLFKSYDYNGKESKPEWGINLSEKNYELLTAFSFKTMIGSLL